MRYNPPPTWPAAPAGWAPEPGWKPDPAWGPPPAGWPLWVDERSWASRHKGLIITLVLLTVFVGVPVAVDVGNSLSTTSNTSRRPAPEETAVGAEAALSAHDQKVLADLGRYPGQWNAAAQPLVADYQDPNVTAEAWVASARGQVDDMRSAVQGFERQVLGIQDAGVRSTLQPMVENYKRKLAAVVSLWNAVADGDSDAETAATDELTSAGQEGQELAADFLGRLRPYMSEADLDRLGGR